MNPETNAKAEEMSSQDVPMSAPPAYPGPPVWPPSPGVPQPVTATVTVNQPVAAPPIAVPVLFGQQMGNKPSRIICRMCNQEMVTRIETNASLKTHLFALLLCGLGCWCCVCIPYFIDSCKKTNHYCTTCGAYIGFYN